MASFAVTQVLDGGDLPFASGIRDLFVWISPTGPVLYAATLNGGGVSAFAIGPDGTLGLRGAMAYDAVLDAGIRPDMAVARIDGVPSLIVSGLAERALRLDGDGSPLGWSDPGGWNGTPGHLLEVELWGNPRLLSGASGSGVSVVSPSAGYTRIATVPTVDASAFVQTADGMLFALSATDDSIVRLVSGGVGSLSSGQIAGALDGLGWNGPSSAVTAIMAGTQYIIVGAAGSSSLTVLSFDGATFRIHDHVIDDRTTRFAGVTDLATLSVNGRTLVAATGADDGVTLFELLPNGRLVATQVVEDTTALTLANPTAVGLARAGDRILLVTAAEADPGLTVFSRPVGTLAAPILGSVAADTLNGTAADDLIVASAGDDRLSGGAGDDILHDGEGADAMSGGSGADLFVLASDGATDRILDFDPAQDRLDLSLWGGLYAVSAVSILPTTGGATLRFGDERLEITSASGSALGAEDFTLENTIGLTRVPLSPIGRDLAGGDGPDTLTGADGSDRLSGRGGDDILTGLGGDDALVGGDGRDTLDGGAGRDSLAGDAGADLLTGGAGSDLLLGGAGDDTLDGGDGADVLSGGAGNDRLNGNAGADVLRGGDGRDTLSGGDGADRLSGGAGDDVLTGGGGRDLLDGGSGNDRMTGGAGPDVFVFRDGGGADRVTDFEPGGGDRIDLSGLTGARSWADLVPTLTEDGGDVLLETAAGDRLVLDGIGIGALSADDFWF